MGDLDAAVELPGHGNNGGGRIDGNTGNGSAALAESIGHGELYLFASRPLRLDQGNGVDLVPAANIGVHIDAGLAGGHRR